MSAIKPKRNQRFDEEPAKKQKQSELLRAKEDSKGDETFFEPHQLEEAKQWLMEKWVENGADEDDDCAYYIERCSTEKVEHVYQLDKDDFTLHKNTETLAALQEAVPALTDEAVKELLAHLSHLRASITVDW